MIASFKDIAAAMTRCVSIIEDYARASPIGPPKPTRNHNSNIASSLLTSSDIPISPQQPSKEEPKKERKVREKKIKDPNAPKRPPSAYILFQNEVRQQIRETNTGMPYKEVLGIIAEKWKTLPDDQKRVCQSLCCWIRQTYWTALRSSVCRCACHFSRAGDRIQQKWHGMYDPP